MLSHANIASRSIKRFPTVRIWELVKKFLAYSANTVLLDNRRVRSINPSNLPLGLWVTIKSIPLTLV